MLKIKNVLIKKIKRAKYNPRKAFKRGDKEYESLRKSIKEFGLIDPLIINKDYTLIGGHQRLTVAEHLGYKEVPVVMLNVNKSKEKALNLGLNKIMGNWDSTKLQEILAELLEENIDIMLTGFDQSEIDKLLGINNKKEENPEYEFTQELLEEHNYIVLVFDNELDWNVAQEKFKIKQKYALITKKGKKLKSAGIGRVVNGADILEKL